MIQGSDVTLLQALYHVTEHFGKHAGQIIFIAKLWTGTDRKFYEIENSVARPTWR